MSWQQDTRSHLDDFVCSSHKDQIVSIYCQSCDVLICPKCITQGPSKSNYHKQHVYLDLADAYLIKQKQLNQVITNFKDATQTKKNERCELNALGQRLKLELLRKKTAISKQTHCLHDAITKQEKSYVRHIEMLLKPAITRNELRFNEVDFEVVSREGALGSGESVCHIPEEKPIQFLRAMKRIESDLVKLSADSGPVSMDSAPELRMVQKENLSLHQYKSLITRAFTFPNQVPSVPHVLSSWCTVGVTSASITFKCPNSYIIQSYIVVCQPYSTFTEDKTGEIHMANKWSKSARSDLEIIRQNREKFAAGKGLPWRKRGPDSQVFRVKSTMGRVTAVIRNLLPHTSYIVQIHAINSCGSSQPTKLYLTTLSYSETKGCGRVSLTDPHSYRSVWVLCQVLLTASKYVLLLFLLLWVLYAIFISWPTVYEDGKNAVTYICDFVATIKLPYVGSLRRILLSKPFVDYLSFLMLMGNTSEDSLVEESATDNLFTDEANTLDSNIQSKWFLQSVWEWINRFGENSTGVLF
ncbi:hypothetical protein LSH36_502g02066 [Paralvinella palmiformis]|uniref:B box-type domain-containing protein n=1 Tax=Paralvinella palmiformis TaxID=53620 RepID=A0AAD9MYG6_9ANNE|nr:hypothetical protein LSH36_502g02066 [Paralvinella palmiformis]